MTKRKKFAAFILTHGRPDAVLTYESFRAAGYTGDLYLIIDNEDKTADEYRRRFGNDRVIMFDKAAAGETFDIADTRTDRRATVFARNASFQIAKQLGLEYFMQLDDDYVNWSHRWVTDDDKCHTAPIRSMDQVLDAMIRFLDDSGACSVAMSQGGDHLGGTYLKRRKMLLRKAMNTFVFRTDSPVTFIGRMNDDVNTYVTNTIRGRLFFTILALDVTGLPTQKASGGMTEMYLDTGTYMKSFYTVMMAPSCVRVEPMKSKHSRLHHNIRWNNCAPKIISDKHRKPR